MTIWASNALCDEPDLVIFYIVKSLLSLGKGTYLWHVGNGNLRLLATSLLVTEVLKRNISNT